MSIVTTNDNILPLTPNAVTGSPDPNPLLSAIKYQKITGDQKSCIPDIEEAVNEAVEDLSHECRRTWLYGQYTEAQRLYANGMVYPSATPIDVTMPITSNLDDTTPLYDPTTDNLGSSVIQGDGIWVGWFSPLPWMPVFAGVLPAQTVLTYWGGFTQTTLPSKVQRMIAKIVYYRLNPYMLQGMPGGVKSMSVNGVSISGDLSSMMDSDPALKSAIRRWRHPQADPWQS
jgi:hypothetical protein